MSSSSSRTASVEPDTNANADAKADANTEADGDFERLSELLKRSHTTEDNDLQLRALQASLNYLGDHPESQHWFCDNKYFSPAIHLLILFSLPADEVSDILPWVKKRIEQCLDQCIRCVGMFHRGRSKLKERFLKREGSDPMSVEQFNNIVLSWEAEALYPRFIEYYDELRASDNSTVPSKLLICAGECLCGPGMLRLNRSLKELFDEFHYMLLVRNHSFVQEVRILGPGLLYLLFEGNDVQKKWAFEMIQKLYLKITELNTLNNKPKPSPTTELLEEYELHLLEIQNPEIFTEEKCEEFYRNMFVVIRCYSNDSILKPFDQPEFIRIIKKASNFEVVSLFKLIQKHIMSYPKNSLPYVLRVFAYVLFSVGSKYWDRVQPFTFQNILETITANPNYVKHLITLKHEAIPENELNPTARLVDIVSWIEPFLESLTTAQKLHSFNKLSIFFIGVADTEPALPEPNRASIHKRGCRLLSAALTLPEELYSPLFRNQLLSRNDSRVAVDHKLKQLINYAAGKAIIFHDENRDRLKNSEVQKCATELICKALRFDFSLLAQSAFDIHNGTTTSELKPSPQLLKELVNVDFATERELAFQLLCSMQNVSGIIPLSGRQETEANDYLNLLREFFVRFSDIDTSETKQILSNRKSLNGYWSCVFSSNSDLYQSAVDILYETFDAAGRLEGVHQLLANNMSACIEAINSNITNLIFIKFYEPCPRAVKVLSDVMHGLNNHIDGLFGKSSEFSDELNKGLLIFWNRCWTFLDLIYVETLKWANKYPDNELVEFTRDTLDLSHAVLDSFKVINSLSKESPFSEITNTFPHMLVWLRLSDPGLLSSCVELIKKTLDLASDLGLTLQSNVIELLAKYASRAKKFSNRLTAQQSEEILLRARVFDKELVAKVIIESDAYRKSKEPKEDKSDISVIQISSKSSSSSPAPMPSRPKGQLKIDNFGSLMKTPHAAPVPHRPAPLPMSALEKARKQIVSARKIHPPAPPGFNIRNRHQLTKGHDSSDEDGDETEDFRSLFSVGKKLTQQQKPGITLIDDVSTLAKQKRAIFEEKRREEKFSRLRLNVDLKPLYEKVLKWSFNHDKDYPQDEAPTYKSVADTFKDADAYISTYEPLLLLECWQAILSARKRESENPLAITVASKSTVDNFFEVYFSITRTELNQYSFTESDLAVLSIGDKDRKPRIKDIKESKMTCLAKVHEIKHVKGENLDVTLRVTRSANMNAFLAPSSSIYMMRIMQMTTIEREYSSLHGLRYYGLSDQILKAVADTPARISDKEINTVRDVYNVNDSQAKAIASSIRAIGFSLIQGPPGTGKTKTILGIISYMLSSFQNSNVITLPGQSHSDGNKKRKILVCAPSNAAVDELVIRLKDGIINSRGEKSIPKLVRLGRTDAINSAVKDMTLEELVDSQLSKSNDNNNSRNNIQDLLGQLSQVKKDLEECRAKIADQKVKTDEKLYSQRRELNQKANNIKKKLDEERELQNSIHRSREINRRNIQAKILEESEIICSTLSGSAHDMVANMGITFDSVIIDEACQCTELSAIIPLRYGCRRCIMVGDPNQLPPTVLSSIAAESNYDQSLFVRMASHTKPLLLNVQYRMHSSISEFPSRKFYNGELKDGPNMDQSTARPWHENPGFPPYKFFDIIEGQQAQNSKTMSFTNRMEVEYAIELIDRLFNLYSKIDFRNKIGIITPYKEQNRLIQNTFMRKYGSNIKREISFNTVDGFQGQEKEIIIMSCVRADPASKGVGFLRDYRRMNVALTRAKCSLWILGHDQSLIKNELWNDLISDARSRNMFLTVRSNATNLNVIGPSSGERTISRSPDASVQNKQNESKEPRKPSKQRKQSKTSKPSKLNESNESLAKKVPVFGHRNSAKKTNISELRPSRSNVIPKLVQAPTSDLETRAKNMSIPGANSVSTQPIVKHNSGMLPPPSSVSGSLPLPSSSNNQLPHRGIKADQVPRGPKRTGTGLFIPPKRRR